MMLCPPLPPPFHPSLPLHRCLLVLPLLLRLPLLLLLRLPLLLPLRLRLRLRLPQIHCPLPMSQAFRCQPEAVVEAAAATSAMWRGGGRGRAHMSAHRRTYGRLLA